MPGSSFGASPRAAISRNDRVGVAPDVRGVGRDVRYREQVGEFLEQARLVRFAPGAYGFRRRRARREVKASPSAKQAMRNMAKLPWGRRSVAMRPRVTHGEVAGPCGECSPRAADAARNSRLGDTNIFYWKMD